MANKKASFVHSPGYQQGEALRQRASDYEEALFNEVVPMAAPHLDQTVTNTVLGTQVGGDHYTKQAIQPIEYIWANGLGFSEGNVVKYVTRYKDKGGIKDLQKARHHLDLLIEHLEAKEREDKAL